MNPLRLVALYVLGCFSVLLACSVLQEAESPRVSRFLCHVEAIRPLTGDVLEAEQLVRDMYAGKASLGAVLANLEASAAEVQTLNDAIAMCNEAFPVNEEPAPDPAKRAPPRVQSIVWAFAHDPSAPAPDAE